MPGVDTVDLTALRGAPPDIRQAAADRIYRCWLPLFPHLRSKDVAYIQDKYVDDPRPVVARAFFGREADGADRGLVIVRILETMIETRPAAVMTLHVGLHPPLRIRDGFNGHIIRTMVAYKLRRPGRQFLYADIMTNPAVYLTCRRFLPGVRPAPEKPLPQSWSAVVDLASEIQAARPVPGAALGAVETSLRSLISDHERAAWQERARVDPVVAWALPWFAEGRGLIVAVELTPATLCRSIYTTARYRLERRLGRARPSPRAVP